MAFRESCYYGSDPNDSNSDGDGREMASINNDSSVNVVDQQQVAQSYGVYPFGAEAYKYDFDITKDGAINVVDLQQLTIQLGACP